VKKPTLLQQNRVKVSEVVTHSRLRPISEAGVESLIASINETGVMKDAIHVRRKKDGSLHLIAGGHRTEAARRLGWEEIEAKIWTDVTDDWARLMEIDDNLAGAEMNALDTAVFLATRKAVYERLHPESRADAFHGNQHTGKLASDIVSFATATAEKFGVTKRHIERMVAAGVWLGPDEVSRLRAAPRAVTLKDLTEIGKIGTATERYGVVRHLSEGTAKSAAEARRLIKPAHAGPVKDPVDEAFKTGLTWWKRAPMAARRRMVAELEGDLRELLADLDRGDA
jgi:ParB family chromosome partitioning protein